MTELEYLREARELAGRNQYGQAIDVLERAVAMGDESCEICKELARLSLTVSEVRAFTNWSHEASRIDPSDPEPGLMMGRVLIDLGRWEEAAEALVQSIATARLTPPDLAEAQSLLDQARRAHLTYKSLHPGSSNI